MSDCLSQPTFNKEVLLLLKEEFFCCWLFPDLNEGFLSATPAPPRRVAAEPHVGTASSVSSAKAPAATPPAAKPAAAKPPPAKRKQPEAEEKDAQPVETLEKPSAERRPKKDNKDKKEKKEKDKKAPQTADATADVKKSKKNNEKLPEDTMQSTEVRQEKQKPGDNAVNAGRGENDVWWSDELQRGCRNLKTGILVSGECYNFADNVYVKFEDGFEWRVPHLVPYDLVKKEKGGVPLPSINALRNPPEQAKPKRVPKAKNKIDKPVPDYDLDIIKCRYTTQGKHPPLVKVEVREDRNDATSKWRQKMQIIIKDEVTPKVAMNVAKTFADCFLHMNLVPDHINYKECRDALLKYNLHDWTKGPMKWTVVAKLCLKPFPPAYLECT